MVTWFSYSQSHTLLNVSCLPSPPGVHQLQRLPLSQVPTTFQLRASAMQVYNIVRSDSMCQSSPGGRNWTCCILDIPSTPLKHVWVCHVCPASSLRSQCQCEGWSLLLLLEGAFVHPFLTLVNFAAFALQLLLLITWCFVVSVLQIFILNIFVWPVSPSKTLTGS